MDDVILKASLYGIHNPLNYHSFCNTALVTAPSLVVSSLNVFIPSPCVSCELIVVPFVNSCICLRCRCVAHRTCVRKVDSKCNAALFQGLESGAQGIDNGSVEKDLETIISKVCLIPKVLNYIPEPASEFCLWQSIGRAVAQRFPINQRFYLRAVAMDCHTAQRIIVELLNDIKTLPSQLARVLHNCFINVDFTSEKEALIHARECLDTLVCALFTYFSHDSNSFESVDSHLKEIICNTCDNFMLNLNFGIMYNKIFRCTLRRVSQFVGCNIQQNEQCSANIRSSELNLSNDILLSLKSLLTNLVEARTVTDKLDCLVKILQTLTASKNIPSRGNEESEIVPDGQKSQLDTGISTQNFIGKKEDGSNSPARIRSPDTDELLDVFCNVIQSEMSIESIHWLAEFAYMSCSILLRESDSVSIGPQGYALVTLQQCMHILYGIDMEEIDVTANFSKGDP